MKNDDMQDFKIDSSTKVEATDTGTKRPVWPFVLLALVVVGVVIYFLRSKPEAEPVSEPAVAEATGPAISEPTVGESELVIGEVPTLEQSDPWLREIVRQLTTHPEIARWLVTDELTRTAVVVVDNVAEGKPPASHLDFLAPDEGFQVRQVEGKTVIDRDSYRRYDEIVDVIESIDTNGAAELYRAMQPMLQEAYEDLGYPGQSFDIALGRAVQRLLAVPVVDGPIEVESEIASYRFVDPNLEQLSPVAKQFLRLGPENLRRLQAKVRALARASGISAG